MGKKICTETKRAQKITINESELEKIITESIREQFGQNPNLHEELSENVQEEGWVGALVGGTMGAVFGRACADALYGILKKSAVQAALGAAIGHAVQEQIKANPQILNPLKKRDEMGTNNIVGNLGNAVKGVLSQGTSQQK